MDIKWIRLIILIVIILTGFLLFRHFKNSKKFEIINELEEEVETNTEKIEQAEVKETEPALKQKDLEESNKKIVDLEKIVVSLQQNIQKLTQELAEQVVKVKEMDAKKTDVASVAAPAVVQSKKYPAIKYLDYTQRKRILITGGAGFVGSHLVDFLMMQGHEVIALDNFYTGSKRNVEHWIGHENFELMNHDIADPITIEVDEIYHLASPASPPHYMKNPIKTIKANTMGTLNVLGLARRTGAKVFLASTSEIYGDPMVHPQTETYYGNVNSFGPRSCYDEGKRAAEALMYAYHQHEKIPIRVGRIFNTYGPRMHLNDGRVVSNFVLQALQNQPITVYGSGNQTRSFQYVSDLVRGIVALMNSNYTLPVNLGNPVESTVNEFAETVLKTVGGDSKIVHKEAVVDDPHQRKPDISRAKKHIGWEPKVPLKEGLAKTIDYFRTQLEIKSYDEKILFVPENVTKM